MSDTTNPTDEATRKDVKAITNQIMAIILAGFAGFMIAMALESSRKAPTSVSGYIYGKAGIRGDFLQAQDDSGHCYVIWVNAESKWTFKRVSSAEITLKRCDQQSSAFSNSQWQPAAQVITINRATGEATKYGPYVYTQTWTFDPEVLDAIAHERHN